MAGLRVHTVMPQELVDRVDAAACSLRVSRGEFVRRAVEQALGSDAGSPDLAAAIHHPAPAEQLGASEQALGSSGRAGVRGRVPASAPAEQPRGVYVGPEVEAAALAEQPHRFIEAPASRVRSSSVARPFRPAPKQGKK